MLSLLPFGKWSGALASLLFFGAILICHPVRSQDEGNGEEGTVDIIHMKDGSVFKGSIQDLGTDTVTIELKGGNTIDVSRSRIADIEFDAPTKGKEKDPGNTGSSEGGSEKKEEKTDYYGDEDLQKKNERYGSSSSSGSNYREGYQHHIAQGFFVNDAAFDPTFGFLLSPQVYSLHTYRTSPHFAGGIYAGLQILSNVRPGDLYNGFGLNFTGDLISGASGTPFYDIQAGYSHNLRTDASRDGFFGSFGLGGKAYFGNGSGMSILLSYQMFRLQTEYSERNIVRHHHISGMGIRITFHL